MSDKEAINPYAPPQTERHDASLDDETILRARFAVDDRFQRQIAYDLIMPGALLLTSSILVLGVCMLLGAVLTPIDLKTKRQPNRYLLGAGLIGFPVGSCAAIAYHIAVHKWLKRRNLQRLKDHPVLQATGEWVLEANAAELFIQTSAGLARFPLGEIWWHPPRSEFVLMQVPGPIPIGIPKKSELDPPLTEEFARLLRKRVRRVPFT